MKKENRNVLIGVGVIGALALIWYLVTRSGKDGKTEEKVLKDAYDNLQFELGKAIIKPVSFPSLDELAQTLKDAPDWKLKLTGHTDNTGSPGFNLRLSKQRAEAVGAYLVSKGVAADRITTDGLGASKPIASNATAEGREANRRVEFVIVKGDVLATT
jgi:OOP family OmpA-OmpF porin